jgi:proline dehydrogenase
MSFKKKLAATGLVRFIAHNTPFMQGMGKKLVPATEPGEAADVARKLKDMGYHVCLHHLGKASSDVNDIQKNVAIVTETLDILDEERLEICVSLTPAELGYLKSNKGGEGHSKQIGRSFASRVQVRDVEERHGFGDGKEDGERNLLMLHASEQVPMQRVLALYGALARSKIPVCVTIPAGLMRSIDDVKVLISQAGMVRLSTLPAKVSDARSLEYDDLIRENYFKLAKFLLSEDAMIQQVVPIFALEDDEMADNIKNMADFQGWSSSSFEFEIPYGVNNALKRRLLEEGYTVRVLVPFGKEWWPYFLKRSQM